ncbi:MAG: hypothetical protein JGK04_28290 [Microcoleus sp. PH2017_39_LGB_O_B]|nr:MULTISPECIES: hypothetical protein [unclassified Microcoleus]MCC3451348.1 hypothetical protein [Microcoleus sp. PH2017_09_SFU_O_A]MCC3632219.1 hypothetical protein [Microcoleus sp. PH2017_39_LGB_O_B]MCC3644450.1 hypothetical protein [Microcoleus sp. PH2017_33_LGB_O_A]
MSIDRRHAQKAGIEAMDVRSNLSCQSPWLLLRCDRGLAVEIKQLFSIWL